MDDWEGRSKDSISLNKYLYGNGNPVSGIAPSGNLTLTEVNVTQVISKSMRTIKGKRKKITCFAYRATS